MTVDQANEILESCGIENTDNSDQGDYFGFQEIGGVVHLCDCNTCTPYDGFERLTHEDIVREAAEWLECTADE